MNELTQVGRYDEAKQAASLVGMQHTPTLAQRMDANIREAESRLADLEEAREILNANPDMERLLNIMQKGRF